MTLLPENHSYICDKCGEFFESETKLSAFSLHVKCEKCQADINTQILADVLTKLNNKEIDNMAMEFPTYEVKLNSEHVDDIQCNELEEDKVILQQFKGEEEFVYLCLNGSQVKVLLRDIKMVVDMFYDTYVNTLK